ncbi:MAG: cytochrome C [Nitrospirales bacterium]|nr:cytochrome C [Nitrospirales bacterium]
MKILRCALLLLFIIVPLAASGEQKAKTIDELAKMYDSSGCKACHAEIYAQWEKSHHARPLMGVQGGLMLVPVVKSSAFAPKDPKQATLKNFPCFKCHLPQAFTSAEDSFAADLAQALLAGDKEKVSKLQITCLVCHNEKAIIHRLQEGPPEKNVIYGTRNIDSHPDKVFTKVKKSVIMREAIMCGQCHGTGPNFEFENPVQCATLYGSYQHNYLSHGGLKTCQECHMPKVNGKTDHLFAPDWNNKEQTSALLGRSLNLDVQTLGYQWLRKAGALIPLVVVNTKITHTAGHRIPDG